MSCVRYVQQMEKDGYAAAAGRKVAEKLGLGLNEGVEDDGLDCTWQLGERFTSTDEARAKGYVPPLALDSGATCVSVPGKAQTGG